jgi:D-sedoheptulose 7-phosphate isomerase
VLLLFDAGEGDAGPALAAIAAAQAQEMTVVALAGRGGGALREALAETDVMIAVPHERSPRVLEMHLLVLHCLCDAVDLQLMGEQDP